jgi:glutamate synthase domain-containing protein 3
VRYTGSARARRLLARWDESVALFQHVVPKSNVAQIEDEHEGTLGGAEEAEELAATGASA